MAIIYETKNFILESHEKPEISREEGGHIKISPKKNFVDRTELSKDEAIELMMFTIVSGIAFKKGMKKRGVEIGRINYQDNGNWKPSLHIHLYGRAINAKIQKYGDPVIPGNKKEFIKLDDNDIFEIKKEIELLIESGEYL